MAAVQTTVHVGADRVLRLELPVEERDCDVTVTVTVDSAQPGQVSGTGRGTDLPAPDFRRLVEAGIRVPPPGSWNARRVLRLKFSGDLY